jgi:hypothetical protein
MMLVCDESPVAPRTHRKNPWIEDGRPEIDDGTDYDDDDGSGDGQ